MQVTLAHIGSRINSKDGFEELASGYIARCSSFADCRSEAIRTEEAMLARVDKQRARTSIVLVLLDSRGRQMNSESFAAWLGRQRDNGAQHVLFAIGPARGWSEAARARADLLLSLGPLTMAHALARLVMAEQLYRVFTILTGHPYHSGH